jgi:hypothetical protein
LGGGGKPMVDDFNLRYVFVEEGECSADSYKFREPQHKITVTAMEKM